MNNRNLLLRCKLRLFLCYVDFTPKNRIMKELINRILSKCKFSVSIEVNQHRDYCETVEKHLEDRYSWGNETLEEGIKGIGEEVYEKMVETNTIIDVQVYPRTAVGFYRVFHYDLTEGLCDEALQSSST